MKAYRIHSPHTIVLDEMDAMPVGENCVKLKNLICGMSMSDFSVYTGNMPVQYPLIPVRQCVGFVSEVGFSVRGLARGNRVVTFPQAACHTCNACKDVRFYDCENASMFGVDDDGFLSDFSVVAASDVFAIPDRLKDEEAIFTEQTAIAINVLSRLNVDKGEHIVIVGATVTGIILAQVAMYYQAVPIVIDMNEDMLDIARKIGVYYTVDAVNEDVSKKIVSITGGHMADACAYMLSSPMPLQNVFDLVSKNGRIALVGRLNANELKCNLGSFVAKNLRLITVGDCGKNYPSAINMLANHTVAVDSLIDKIVPFADVPSIMENYDGGDGCKILVKM